MPITEIVNINNLAKKPLEEKYDDSKYKHNTASKRSDYAPSLGHKLEKAGPMPKGIMDAFAHDMQPAIRNLSDQVKFSRYSDYLDAQVGRGSMKPEQAHIAKLTNPRGKGLSTKKGAQTSDHYVQWLSDLGLPDTRAMRKQYQQLLSPKISKGWTMHLGASIDEGAGRPSQRQQQMSQMGEDEERLGFGF